MMNNRISIEGAVAEIDKDGDLAIHREGLERESTYFSRQVAPELIAFIQQWLDHDPEQELRDSLKDICYGQGYEGEERWNRMIAVVREHDKKYGEKE